MRIVHLMGYFVPELGYQEYYLAREHKRMGHDVYIVTSDMFYPFPDIENMLKEAGAKDTSRKKKPGFSVVDGINVHRLSHIIEYSDFILVKGLKKILEKIKPDVVFAHESRQGTPALAAYYKKKIGYRLVVDQHDFFHKIPHHHFVKKILRNLDYFIFRKQIVNFSLRKADKIVAVTEKTKKFLKNTHNVNSILIPLGVDTNSFDYSKKGRGRIRNKYNIQKDDVVVIFAGTIVRRKGLELLLNSFSELKQKNAKLLIVGGGDKKYMKELKELTKKIGVAEKTIFSGFVNKTELPDYFSAADIGVWPGNNSVIIMEAMACNLPVIMVDLQLSHLVGYSNGFKFKENDKQSLKKYMERLICNPKLRKKMGKNSHNGILKDYSYKELAKKFIRLVN